MRRDQVFESGVYRRRAARPTTAAIPGMAVCIAPAALDEDELEDPVAAEAADDAAELALDATLLAWDRAELAVLDAPARAELATDEALEAFEEALPPAPPP